MSPLYVVQGPTILATAFWKCKGLWKKDEEMGDDFNLLDLSLGSASQLAVWKSRGF